MAGAGVGAGIVYGYLGAWWGRSRSVIPAALLALPFFVEPLAWRVYNGYLKGPAITWLCEALVGAGLLAVMILVSRRLPLRGAEQHAPASLGIPPAPAANRASHANTTGSVGARGLAPSLYG